MEAFVLFSFLAVVGAGMLFFLLFADKSKIFAS